MKVCNKGISQTDLLRPGFAEAFKRPNYVLWRAFEALREYQNPLRARQKITYQYAFPKGSSVLRASKSRIDTILTEGYEVVISAKGRNQISIDLELVRTG